MLKNNKINAVIAFVAAVLLWIYVVGQVNPQTNARVTGIPVVFAGEELLADNDLALVDPGDVTVDITISGSRSDVRKVVSNSRRITAVADVSGLAKGEQTVTLDISVPSSVDLQKSSMDEVTVQIDDLVTEEFEIEVDYEGTFEESQKPGEVTIDPQKVAVTGAASTVASIDRVHAVVPAEELSETVTNLSLDIVPVDTYGQVVEHVSMTASKASVTTGLVASKIVPFKVKTKGAPAQGYEVTDVACPSTVTIEGPLSVIQQIEEVEAGDIDVAGLSGDVVIDLNPSLPKDVEVVEPKTLQATVTIEAASSKTWTYDASEITIDDLADGYTAEISGTVKVTVSAEKAVLEALKKADIVLHVSASGLEEGEQEVAVTQVSDLEDAGVVIDPEKVKLKITGPEETDNEETGE